MWNKTHRRYDFINSFFLVEISHAVKKTFIRIIYVSHILPKYSVPFLSPISPKLEGTYHQKHTRYSFQPQYPWKGSSYIDEKYAPRYFMRFPVSILPTYKFVGVFFCFTVQLENI